ncbi:hypothetical protein SAMN05660649_04028 [Desulfotomaculum arcticum]|uniref:Uncharacterized protein n=1 Tax=Desulfotruncus arcticus DSM 17038 TaxID=1121424 RepID=A0A1I2XM06_9FIRM|nr:hypothetical protein [Desulfotruncus arcticus]SFH14442.1 hypothetical protein SAMN05660649_04028 [Desulfotomaculum arcticum] [Desulfotruncus arcticus DSM 17038]
MKHAGFEEQAKEILIQVLPGCLNYLEQTGANSHSDLSMDELLNIATEIEGTETGHALTFSYQLIKAALATNQESGVRSQESE